MFPGVLASRASEGQGGLSAQGLNRMGSGMGGGSGQLESIEGPRRCWGRCPGVACLAPEDGLISARGLALGASHGSE